ncbi:hypothetical protein [Nocardia abscessus]|nr:hypothetical protein [Nocardia abscessus]
MAQVQEGHADPVTATHERRAQLALGWRGIDADRPSNHQER